jgi:2-polyprenyl-3-methyl-5-hydroxy-6-metoxy-1,4-benzoquinol methylase
LYKLSTKRDETIYNKIKNFLPPPPSRLLNLGCGLNTLSDRLQSLNYNISCVDINDISISKKNIFVYDGKNLPQCNYDACILSTVLHHIPIEEHDRIIKMISKCCKRLIIVEDDNDYILTTLICMITNVQFYNHPRAFRSYREWKSFLSNYGNILISNTDKKKCVFCIEFYN